MLYGGIGSAELVKVLPWREFKGLACILCTALPGPSDDV